MIKVYISTPLLGDIFNLKRITNVLLQRNDVFAFIPPVGQLEDKNSGALLDKNAILKGDWLDEMVDDELDFEDDGYLYKDFEDDMDEDYCDCAECTGMLDEDELESLIEYLKDEE